MDVCRTMRIEQAAKVLGIGRTAAYSAAKRGEIPTIRIGKLKLVPKSELDRMLMNSEKTKEAAA